MKHVLSKNDLSKIGWKFLTIYKLSSQGLVLTFNYLLLTKVRWWCRNESFSSSRGRGTLCRSFEPDRGPFEKHREFGLRPFCWLGSVWWRLERWLSLSFLIARRFWGQRRWLRRREDLGFWRKAPNHASTFWLDKSPFFRWGITEP